MKELCVWALVVLGLTIIVTQSTLFKPLRRICPWKLLCCPMCFGFWVGALLSFFMGISISPQLPYVAGWDCLAHPAWSKMAWVRVPLYCVFDGCAASALNWIVYVVLEKLGARDL